MINPRRRNPNLPQHGTAAGINHRHGSATRFRCVNCTEIAQINKVTRIINHHVGRVHPVPYKPLKLAGTLIEHLNARILALKTLSRNINLAQRTIDPHRVHLHTGKMRSIPSGHVQSAHHRVCCWIYFIDGIQIVVSCVKVPAQPIIPKGKRVRKPPRSRVNLLNLIGGGINHPQPAHARNKRLAGLGVYEYLAGMRNILLEQPLRGIIASPQRLKSPVF